MPLHFTWSGNGPDQSIAEGERTDVFEDARFWFCLPKAIQFHPTKSSGAETILGQGGQDQKRQSLEREIGFAEIGLFFVPNTSAFSKKKKRSSPDLEWSFKTSVF